MEKWQYSYLFEKRYIEEIYVHESGEWISFDLLNEKYLFGAGGDCCSQSYIYEINGWDALKDETIISVEEKELGEVDSEFSLDDCCKAYCITFCTTKGRCDVIFRNESNGFYGGDLWWVDLNCTARLETQYVKDHLNRVGYKEITSNDWKIDEPYKEEKKDK